MLQPEVDQLLDEAQVEFVARADRMWEAVRMARNLGATWAQLGVALGVSKQAAQQRYGTWREQVTLRQELAGQLELPADSS